MIYLLIGILVMAGSAVFFGRGVYKKHIHQKNQREEILDVLFSEIDGFIESGDMLNYSKKMAECEFYLEGVSLEYLNKFKALEKVGERYFNVSEQVDGESKEVSNEKE